MYLTKNQELGIITIDLVMAIGNYPKIRLLDPDYNKINPYEQRWYDFGNSKLPDNPIADIIATLRLT